MKALTVMDALAPVAADGGATVTTADNATGGAFAQALSAALAPAMDPDGAAAGSGVLPALTGPEPQPSFVEAAADAAPGAVAIEPQDSDESVAGVDQSLLADLATLAMTFTAPAAAQQALASGLPGHLASVPTQEISSAAVDFEHHGAAPRQFVAARHQHAALADATDGVVEPALDDAVRPELPTPTENTSSPPQPAAAGVGAATSTASAPVSGNATRPLAASVEPTVAGPATGSIPGLVSSPASLTSAAGHSATTGQLVDAALGNEWVDPSTGLDTTTTTPQSAPGQRDQHGPGSAPSAATHLPSRPGQQGHSSSAQQTAPTVPPAATDGFAPNQALADAQATGETAAVAPPAGPVVSGDAASSNEATDRSHTARGATTSGSTSSLLADSAADQGAPMATLQSASADGAGVRPAEATDPLPDKSMVDQGSAEPVATSPVATTPVSATPVDPAPVATLPADNPALAPVSAPSTVAHQSVTALAPALAAQVSPALQRLVHQGEGVHRLTLELNPEALGEVKIVVSVRHGEVHVRLAPGAEAQAAIQASLPELQRTLDAMGLKDVRLDLQQSSSFPLGTEARSQFGQEREAASDQHRAGTPGDRQATDGRDNRGRSNEPVVASRHTSSRSAASLDLTM